MNDALIISAIAIIGMVYIIARQQFTIDRLTDKLMAKDYNEYMRYEDQVDPTLTKRKPMSFFDESANDEEDVH